MIILFQQIGNFGFWTVLDAPALGATVQIDMGNRVLKQRQLHRQCTAGVQREAAAIKYLIILPTDHIEINQRQAGFDHPRHHDILAHR